MPACVGIGRPAIILGALLAAPAQALDVSVQPRASGGVQDYQLTFPDVIDASANSNNPVLRDGFSIRDHLQYAGAGLTVSTGRLFVDLSGQWSKTGHDAGFNAQGNQLDICCGYDGVGQHNHYLSNRFGRHELNAALGWALSSNLSAYIGYKSAGLNITQTRSPFLQPLPHNGDVLQLGSSLMNFTYHGFFIGTTYSLPVSHWGALSVQASIAQLSATFRQHFEGLLFIYTTVDSGGETFLGPPIFLNPSLEDSSVHGTSVGLNAGVSWSGNFGSGLALRGLSYTIGLDQSQYRFHGSAADGDFEEKNTRLRLELRYRFNL